MMEVNIRLCGDLISELLERSLGISIGDLLLRVAVRDDIAFPANSRQPYEIRFLGSPVEGRVLSIPDHPPQIQGLCDYQPYVGCGDILFRNSLIGISRLGHIIRRAPSPGTISEAEFVSFEDKFKIKPALSFQGIPKGSERIALFSAGPEDLPGLVEIESACWPEGMRASPQTISARIRANPDSTVIAYSPASGRPWASIVSVPLGSYNSAVHLPWMHFANLALDTGHAAHACRGEIMYVISISSVPTAPRGTGSAVLLATLNHYRNLGKKRVLCGIPMPNYAKHRKKGVRAEEFLEGLKRGEYKDDLFQLAVIRCRGNPLSHIPQLEESPWREFLSTRISDRAVPGFA
jgi:hypothetical protein